MDNTIALEACHVERELEIPGRAVCSELGP